MNGTGIRMTQLILKNRELIIILLIKQFGAQKTKQVQPALPTLKSMIGSAMQQLHKYQEGISFCVVKKYKIP
jgi:hypothetical protein